LMARRLLIHPFLFALYPILFLAAHNIVEISLREILIPCALSLGVTLIFFIVMSFIFKSSPKSAILTTVLVLLFFSYGHLFERIEDFTLFGFEIGRHRYLLLFWGLLFLSLLFIVGRSKKDFKAVNTFLNLVSIFLIGYLTLQITLFEMAGHEERKAIQDVQNQSTEIIQIGKTVQSKPDIYYIILDSYPRSDTLKNVYGYDNTDFIDRLEGRGFRVAKNSMSNYAMTFLSIASSLNMEYMDAYIPKKGNKSSDRRPFYQIAKNNKISRLLKPLGV